MASSSSTQDSAETKGASSSPALGLCNHCSMPLKRNSLSGKVAGSFQHFCCYGCYLCQRILRENESGSGASHWSLARMALGWLLGGPIMALSLVDYVGGFEGASQAEIGLVYWIVFVLASLIMLLLGLPYAFTALRSLLSGHIGTESLIALGAIAAYGFSSYNFFAAEDYQSLVHNNQLYFDTGSMILILVSLGKFLEANARRKVTAGFQDFSQAQTRNVPYVLSNGQVESRNASELKPGDRIKILPGSEFLVDGSILEGQSSVVESLLTGESKPKVKVPGDKVLAGSINGQGALLISVEAVGEECVRSRLARLAQTALLRRSELEKSVDKVSSFFLPVVVMLSIGSFLYHAFFTELEQGQQSSLLYALEVALSVLVVACPCALGLATPLAIATGVHRGSQFGALFRSGESIEALAKVRRMYLDKTGTLTTGKLELQSLVFKQSCQTKEQQNQILSVLLGLEQQSEHWLAQGICHSLEQRDVTPLPLQNVTSLPGMGVCGELQGQRWWVGKADLAEAPLAQELKDALTQAESKGETPVCIGSETQALACLSFSGQVLKPHTKEAMQALKELGIELVVVTGDHSQNAEAVGKELEIELIHAESSPEQKLALVEAEKEPNRVAMTGDGINDAPALAAAGVGISFQNATGLAQLSAGLTLTGNDLLKLPAAVVLARQVLATIRQNLAWAFLYNSVALISAASGLLSPAFAALVMFFSSFFVLANSRRLSTLNMPWFFKEP